MKKFSISEAVSFGWETFKANVGFFIGLILIFGILTYVPAFLIAGMAENGSDAGFNPLIILLNILSWVIQIVIGIGIIKIFLTFVNGQKPKYSDLVFTDIKVIINYILGSLLYGAIVISGFILLIIPGVIFVLIFSQYSYLIIDKGMGPVQALKESAQITKGARLDLFLFVLVEIGITLLGFLALFVGLFVAIPVVYLANVYIYKKLVANTK